MDKETVTNHIKVVSGFIGFDLQKELQQTTHQISLSFYGEHKLIFKAFVYNEKGEFGFALYCLKEVIEGVLGKIHITTSSIKPESLKELVEELTTLNIILEDYDEWEKNEWLVFMDNLKSHPHFTEEDYSELNKITPDVLIHADDTLEKIHLSVFKKGEEELPESNVFVLSDYFLASEDLNTLMKAVSNFKADDKFYVFPLMKWEENENFSYFVFCVLYKDHIFLVSDQPNFDNPRNKELQGNRNGGNRTRRDAFENFGFPYDLLDRKGESKSTDMVLNGFNFKTALDKFLVQELHPYTKLFLNLFIERSIVKIKTKENLTQLGFYGDYIETHLLGDGSIMTEDSSFEGHRDSVERIGEILNLIDEPMSTDLVKTTRDIIENSEYFDSQTLMPVENFKHLTDWFILEEKRKEYQEKLDKLEFGRKEDGVDLKKLLEDKLPLFEPELFVSDVIYFKSSESIFNDGHFQNKRKTITDVFIDDVRYNTLGDISIGFTPRKNVDHPYHYPESYCNTCNKFKSKRVRLIEINTAEQLVYLLRLKGVEELPPYYRMYKSHEYIPYRGNQILSDVHPLSLLKDPCSYRNPNGIKIFYESCGHCFKKLKKQYYKCEKSIVENGVIRQIEDGEDKLGMKGIVIR
jgi:hypothetical protein